MNLIYLVQAHFIVEIHLQAVKKNVWICVCVFAYLCSMEISFAKIMVVTIGNRLVDFSFSCSLQESFEIWEDLTHKSK
jgi:hypothetical protein